MLHLILQTKLQAAVRVVLPDADTTAVLVRPCPDARHGDYQSNALIPLAKQRKLNPRQLAEQVKAALDVADVCDAVDIAGPGFLNFRVRPAAFAAVLQAAARGEHLFFAKAPQQSDYSVMWREHDKVVNPANTSAIPPTMAQKRSWLAGRAPGLARFISAMKTGWYLFRRQSLRGNDEFYTRVGRRD